MVGELARLENGFVVRTWVVDGALGEGAFGAVYRVRNTLDPKQVAALKLESIQADPPVLKMEVVVLQELKGKRHVCQLFDKGRTETFSFVIMTMVGPSLQDLKKLTSANCLTHSSALRVGIQCLEALKDLHNINYLHRDVKPGNFARGREETQEHRNIFILDFGMARKFTNTIGQYKTPREKAGFRGTIRYAPMACHKREEVGRKDDLEVWFYQQVEITIGRLPWRELSNVNAVGEMKRTSRQDGTLYIGCPPEYRTIVEYIDKLHVVEKPDYAFIGRQLLAVMKRENIKADDPYDWETNAP